ncbi:MAG: hypothetical protein AUJ98_11605 [Bacteroidetes bacterium CG2_30_33_31]|nr:MAG: hypothetical protein AUJ98_11605 [Bacteroidetes bacterium CG2_30_33_31]
MDFRNKLLGIILALLVCFNYSSFAQNQSKIDSINAKTPFTGNYLKFSPTTFLELEPGFQLGYEYSASPKIRLQHEIAYLSLFNPVYQLFNWDYDIANSKSSGIRLRTTAKFPLKIDNYYARIKYKYLGIDMMFKYLSVTEQDVSVRKMNAYWELMDITSSKYIAAVHFLYGMNNYVSFSNNIISDWYIGIGLRYKYLKDDSGIDNLNSNRPFYDENGVILSIMAGVKLGFGI